jgi:hypothetical protein
MELAERWLQPIRRLSLRRTVLVRGRVFYSIALLALMSVPTLAGAQAPAAGPPITPVPTGSAASTSQPGRPSVKVDMVPSLIVMNAHGATLQGQTLTLAGVSANSITFADRPVRTAGHLLTRNLLEEWTLGSFAKDAPNATVSVLSQDGNSVHDAVVELRNPHLDGDRLIFNVRVLEGNLAGADGPASVFIDIIGLPFTPLSFAGGAPPAAPIGMERPPRPRRLTIIPICLIILRRPTTIPTLPDDVGLPRATQLGGE